MKIEFIPSSLDVELYVPPPKPSGLYIPEWYKDIKKDTNIKKIINGVSGIKSCAPFLDSMLHGYIQESWCDIYVDFNEEGGGASYYYAHGPEIINIRQETNIPGIEKDFNPYEFVWRVPWIPKLPKGYSLLFISPINHFELPFFLTSGIIDSDNFYHVGFPNYPFYFKRSFNGFLPAGTPMYQMIPIKRNFWKSQIKTFNEEKMKKNNYLARHKFFQNYKNNFRFRKTFQ
jgi:hypothetical protein